MVINMDPIQSQISNNVILNPSKPISTPRNNGFIRGEIKTDEFVKTNNSQNETKKKFPSRDFLVAAGPILGASAAVIGALVLKYKASRALKLSKDIDFKPQKTVEDAIEFGKKTLGIEHYIGFSKKDVEVINYINEGIVNTSNKLKGKIRMPKMIVLIELKNSKQLAAVVKEGPFKGVLGLNKTIFGDIDNAINKSFEVLEKHKILTPLEEDGRIKYHYSKLFDKNLTALSKQVDRYKQGKLTTLKDKIRLYYSFDSMTDSINSLLHSPLKYLNQIAKAEGAKEFCKEHNIILDLDKIKSLSVKEQFNVLKSLPKELKQYIVIPTDIQNVSLFKTIYHELGHLQDMKPRCKTISRYDKDYSKYPKELKEWVDNEKNMQAAYSISAYSAYGPGEFVAETFARYIAGLKVPDEAAALYKKLGGPEVPLN